MSWCRQLKAVGVAVDAQCGWSGGGASRLTESRLAIGGNEIACFATPTRLRANKSNLYKWVFNGARLYQQLAQHYTLSSCARRGSWACCETFPHAVVCALAGRGAAWPKRETRRNALWQCGYDVGSLTNVDFVCAGLCAITSDAFLHGSAMLHGNKVEGFIVVPVG